MTSGASVHLPLSSRRSCSVGEASAGRIGGGGSPPPLVAAGSPGAVVHDSPHPYPDNAELRETISIPGATTIYVAFHPQSRTERGADTLNCVDRDRRIEGLDVHRGWEDRRIETPGRVHRIGPVGSTGRL